jgi:hypothetical protein
MIELIIPIYADAEATEPTHEYRFEFTHDNVRRAEALGIDPSDYLSHPLTSLTAFVAATYSGEPNVSNSKIKRVVDEIVNCYDALKILADFSEKYNEVFLGGENAPPKRVLTAR